MHLLQHKGHCVLRNDWFTAKEKKFSGRKKLQGEVNVAAAGSGTETPQRRIALLSDDEVLQPGQGRRRQRESGDFMGNGRGSIGRRREEWRVHGRWHQRQMGQTVGYKVILAAGVDNGEAR